MTGFAPLSITHAGRTLAGLVARPAGTGPHPAVLVMHNAMGQGEQVRRSARALADEGYIAIATDMYGGGAFHTDPALAGADIAPLHETPGLLRARVAAWFDAACALDGVNPARVAAIGYCFGGQCVLELARSGADVKAVVSYHGLLGTHAPAREGAIRGVVAVHTGGRDPYAPAADVAALEAEMAAAGANLLLTVYAAAEHGFTDPDSAAIGRPGIAYDALSHRVSWAATLALLDATLRGGG